MQSFLELAGGEYLAGVPKRNHRIIPGARGAHHLRNCGNIQRSHDSYDWIRARKQKIQECGVLARVPEKHVARRGQES